MEPAELAGWLWGFRCAYQNLRANASILPDEDQAFLAEPQARPASAIRPS